MFWFKTTVERHDLLVHTKERRAHQQRARREKQAGERGDRQPDASALTCNFVLGDHSKCGFVAASAHYLRLHKDKEGHKRKRTSLSDGGQKKRAKC